MNIHLFVATKAFITYHDKVVILRESSAYTDGSNSGRFDVVGGRVKPGQRFDESLMREIKEETGLSPVIGRPFYVGEWRPVVKGQKWQIIGTFFECKSDTDRITLSRDHDQFLWIDPKDYSRYNLIDNLIPAFRAFLEIKS